MNTTIICLAFLQMTGTTRLHIPQHIDSMIKTKIIHQFQSHYAKAELKFDNEACPNKGHYWYSANGFVMEANHEHWNGRLENTVSDILDGQKIPFVQNVIGPLSQEPSPNALETVLAAHTEHQAEQKISQRKENTKWIAWTLASAAVVTGGYFLYKNMNSKSTPPTITQTATPKPKPSTDDASLDRASSF